MTLHPRHGIHDPTTGTPSRVSRSIRRTTIIDMLRPDGPMGELVLIGHGRDLLTPADSSGVTLATAGMTANVNFAGNCAITAIRVNPHEPRASALVGAKATTGFRRLLAKALCNQAEQGSLLYQLLDDLPTAALVSGYAIGHAGATLSRMEARWQNNADLCAGWRTGGTIMIDVEAGKGPPLVTGPSALPVETSDDPHAWHTTAPLPPGSMRRRRRLDLHRSDALHIDAMFRDSHVDAEGSETVVHEYTLRAEVDVETLEIRDICAVPRVLPWIECPMAAVSAGQLVGKSVQGFRARVRDELTGIGTCTHLNDMLRSLEDIPALQRSLDTFR